MKEKPDLSTAQLDTSETGKELVLYNDDHNTFEFVIESLIDVCGHNPEQAEQCAFVAHTKGKCAIKSGDFDMLKLLKSEMNQRGLTTKIE
jgi:ATP-dependent Clp protease adaptor protein ClpS